jgi:hypothetical protein
MNLSCPHCGLQLPMRGPRHEYCPQCIADRGQPVPLVASSLFKRDSAGAATRAAESVAAKAADLAGARGRHAF